MDRETAYHAVLLTRQTMSNPPPDPPKDAIVEELSGVGWSRRLFSDARGSDSFMVASRAPAASCGITTRRGRVVALAPPGRALP